MKNFIKNIFSRSNRGLPRQSNATANEVRIPSASTLSPRRSPVEAGQPSNALAAPKLPSEGGSTATSGNGKVARLPKHIREQLNRRLDDNQRTEDILSWLNALPEVQKILAAQFDNALISPRNLSNWRTGGFQRWLQNQEYLAGLKELKEVAADISNSGGGKLAAAAATVVSAKILTRLKNTPDDQITPAELNKSAHAVATLAKVEQNAVRLQHEKLRIRQRDEQLVLTRDRDQRDVTAIGLRLLGDARAKAVEAAPISYAAQNELLGEHLFNDLWLPRLVPVEHGSSAANSNPETSELAASGSPRKVPEGPGSAFTPGGPM